MFWAGLLGGCVQNIFDSVADLSGLTVNNKVAFALGVGLL